MIKEYSVDFNKQTVLCEIKGYGSRLNQYRNAVSGEKIDMDTMLACLVGSIKDYEFVINSYEEIMEATTRNK